MSMGDYLHATFPLNGGDYSDDLAEIGVIMNHTWERLEFVLDSSTVAELHRARDLSDDLNDLLSHYLVRGGKMSAYPHKEMNETILRGWDA